MILSSISMTSLAFWLLFVNSGSLSQIRTVVFKIHTVSHTDTTEWKQCPFGLALALLGMLLYQSRLLWGHGSWAGGSCRKMFQGRPWHWAGALCVCSWSLPIHISSNCLHIHWMSFLVSKMECLFYQFSWRQNSDDKEEDWLAEDSWLQKSCEQEYTEVSFV